jgi:magnesium transporter
MELKIYYLSPEGEFKSSISEEEMQTAFQSQIGTLWVDICDNTDEQGRFLERNFGFHPLAIEDCVSTSIHSPKIDDFDSHLFIIVHGINHMAESDIVETTELAVFLGPHFVVSRHSVPLHSVSSVARMLEKDSRPMKGGADFLAYTLIDTLIDNVLPTIDQMMDVADQIEEEVIRNPHQSTLEDILKLKRSALRIHRVMAPQREVLNRVSRGEFPLIKENAYIFFRDIYDHIVRIEELGQTLRDRADNALATHLASVANRQNESMRILALVATIFLPLALVAGIYGMNFQYMPELGWHWGYFAVVGFIGFVIIFAICWFWARKWIAWSRRRVARVRPFAVEPHKLMKHIDVQMRRWSRFLLE